MSCPGAEGSRVLTRRAWGRGRREQLTSHHSCKCHSPCPVLQDSHHPERYSSDCSLLTPFPVLAILGDYFGKGKKKFTGTSTVNEKKLLIGVGAVAHHANHVHVPASCIGSGSCTGCSSSDPALLMPWKSPVKNGLLGPCAHVADVEETLGFRSAQPLKE